MDEMFREIAHIVADKTINSETHRPYTAATIENAMREFLHYSVHPTRNKKQQALEVIKQLKQKLPITRAQMKVALILPAKEAKHLRERLLSSIQSILEESWHQTIWEATCLIDPGHFRQIDDLIQKETKRKGSLNVLSVKPFEEEGDMKL